MTERSRATGDSSTAVTDCVIVGGGILGLAVAAELSKRRPDASITLIEKETELARHQTGRNSGVIHSGIYYTPGSLKAKLCRGGRDSMVRFAAEHGIAHELCGKLIVATRPDQLDRMKALHDRGRENGLDVSLISPDEAAEIEPHVNCVGAVRVPSTGIIDYVGVCHALADQARDRGVTIRLGEKVTGIEPDTASHRVVTDRGDIRTRFVITCGGQYSDKLARAEGGDPDAQIVPFRGEYYELVPEREHLVRTLIYPVPDPAFPFLGVHFTKMIGGGVHAGPNAVLALAREGYSKTDVNLRELAEVLAYPGFRRLAAKHWRTGIDEMIRSFSRKRFTASLQELIPEVRSEDLVPSPAGIRAQALRPDGSLVDDFLLVERPRALHVCNAPSPAATASLEIAGTIVDRALPALADAGVAEGPRG
ncbi:MAG: L-2-hydroxyglutarate oxidase [Acidimicrobiia bacterium]|nr:L-2-hydroxyglutarate oxidase [Acidimicrobiia bacterium]MDH5520278.1 L-2-hydroxyglutarate oxidase [Acidimicrobiia bacterium]